MVARSVTPVPHAARSTAILNVMTEVSDKLLAELARPGAVVLIGEMHGTHEFPRLVGRLAEVALEQSLAVLVGLEVPASEQPAIDAFMASDGGPRNVAALTASVFWHRPPEHDDGRAGEGLAGLFATARAAAAKGPLRIFAFDQPWFTAAVLTSPEEIAMITTPRDQVMAETSAAAIEAWAASQDRPLFTVLLAGGMHSRIVRYPGAAEPHLAELLVERYPHLVTLEGQFAGGQFRARTAYRAEIHNAWTHRTAPGSIGMHHQPEDVQRSGHHGWVNVGPLTPSLPVG